MALFHFAQGIVAYGSGSGVLRGMGYPGFEFANLDPTSRAPWSTGGCMVSGYELLTQTPYNLAVQSLAWVLGPMPGSYDGPYPDEADAWRRVQEEGISIPSNPSLEELGRLAGAPSYDLVDFVYEPMRYLRGHPENTKLRGLVLEDRLLIVAGSNDADPSAYVVLIDLMKQRRVARYRLRNPGFVRAAIGSP